VRIVVGLVWLLIGAGAQSLSLLHPCPETFTLIGRPQSDSDYAMAELQDQGASLLLSPFLWNLRSAQGEARLTCSSQGLSVQVSMRHFVKIQPQIDVGGYPGVMYGQELWFPFAAASQRVSWFHLPLPVDALPPVRSTLATQTFVHHGSITDLSYDIWLTRNPKTRRLRFPDLELMIWFIHQGTLGPPFLHLGTLKEEVRWHHQPVPVSFAVYLLPHTGSASGWVGIYLLADQELVGTLTLPLTSMIQAIFPYLEQVFPQLTPQTYLLDAIQVGMEFNPDAQGQVDLGYTLRRWSLHLASSPTSE